MNLFFTTNIENNKAFLPEEEARHAVQVLRRKVGDTIHFVDGLGGYYQGVIAETAKKKCVVEITSAKTEHEKRPYSLHIAIAPCKNISRLEWFLEKATEIGIDEITPVICKNSERKKIRPERLEKILMSGMKQSLKAYLPRLNPLSSFDSFIKKEAEKKSDKQQLFFGHCDANQEKWHLKNNYQKGKDVTLLIGPEGDFSPDEIKSAIEHGFGGISLGNTRLRVETAGIVGCTIVAAMNV